MMDDPVERVYRTAIDPRTRKHPGFGYRVEEKEGVRIERDVAVPVRGGLTLYADVFRPAGQTDLPAIICYAPFGKHPHLELGERWAGCDIPFDTLSPETTFEIFDPMRWAKEGFAVCVVDAAGNWFSEGKARYFSQEEAEYGYDVVEWFAEQPWCNGKIGWGGVSYFAMTAWSVAALRPPHLAAILPWDAASDSYRECFFKGGIPSGPLTHNWMLVTGVGLDEVEDMEAGLKNHPLFDHYWSSRVADWSKIEIPVYTATEWGNNLHLRGTVEAWKNLSSPLKFLEINGGKEWASFYSEWAYERQRAFFGQFLKGEANGVEGWSPVRIAVRENGQDWEFRDEQSWPLERVDYRPYYLDTNGGSLAAASPASVADRSYSSLDSEARLNFDLTFAERTEITGNAKLKLWISTDLANDADIFVGIEKLDRDGRIVPFIYSQMYNDGPAAFGWLRASHRALDPDRSTPEQPWHSHQRRDWLVHGEPVPVEVEIWPTNIVFDAGETLRLVVKGSEVHVVPGAEFAIRMWPLHNDGRHVIHSGGQYDSHLLLPVVKPA